MTRDPAQPAQEKPLGEDSAQPALAAPAFNAAFTPRPFASGLDKGSELAAAFAPLKKAVLPVLIVSAVLNVLMLSGSFFMMLVYDEVLPSRSVPTLVGLLLMVSVAYVSLAALDYVRLRIMGHLGAIATGQISTRIMDVIARQNLVAGGNARSNGGQVLRDLDQLRSFLSSPAPLAFIDLPWVLLYLLVLTLFHWSLGLLTLAGVIVLVVLMLVTDKVTFRPLRDLSALGSARYALAEAVERNAEPAIAMGMLNEHQRKWLELEQSHGHLSSRIMKISGSLTSGGKSVRMLLQSLVLALGAYLVLKGQATGGVIIAGSILSARALAPVEQSIAGWKNAVTAKLALGRLEAAFAQVPPAHQPMPLPLPSQSLDVHRLAAGPPGKHMLGVVDVSFSLSPGDAVAVIGRSGSGKSTLARAVCGLWPVVRGEVRLDGATLDQWSQEHLGSAMGYMPQACELLPGTVAQNIARFDPSATAEEVIAAAKDADIHDFILRLPGGYERMLGPHDAVLSAGQVQRIALARALFRQPFLLVLDEPNSNLDASGDQALAQAIKTARSRGAIVLMVAHRPSVLRFMSHVLILNNGRVEEFTTTDLFRKNANADSAQSTANPNTVSLLETENA